MRYQALAFGALLVAVGTGACDGSSGGSSGQTNDEVMRFADDVAAMLCDLSMQCCGPEGFTPPVDCLNTAQRQMRATFQENLDDGATFNPKVGADCLAAYRAAGASCPKRFVVPACEGIFTEPPRPPETCDAACPVSDAGRAICGTSTTVFSDGGRFSAPICKVQITVQPGEICDTYGAAPIERVCDFAKGGGCICDPMQGSNCALGRCAILKPVGAACTTDINSSSVECVDEAVCSNKVCTLRTPVGGACVASECVAGASCQSGTCTANSVWKKYCSGDFD
jgi:hypothetical protein